jgi:hypothetical protein
VTVAAANGAERKITLHCRGHRHAKLLGLEQADQRLDVSGRADNEKRLSMVIANTRHGKPLRGRHSSRSTAPTGWEVSFEPEVITGGQAQTRRPR